MLASELEFGETTENILKVKGILCGKFDLFTIIYKFIVFSHE